MVQPSCRACGATVTSPAFKAREFYFGGTAEHAYVECQTCGTIQIVIVPDDLASFYPAAYRSTSRPPSRLRRLLLRQRGAVIRGYRLNLLGWLLMARYGRPDWAEWMVRTGARLRSRIIDVGCGDGDLLIALAAAGYRDLTGIDPFIDADSVAPSGVRIYKREIAGQAGEYDVVMLHHSLEHMPDPEHALRHVRRLLHPNGTALVRIPLAGTYGWRTYREHWFGLEPPRHLIIPSLDGFRRLTEAAGLRIIATVHDGGGGYYALSEQARAGKAFAGPRRSVLGRAAELYDGADLAGFRTLANERNRAGDGDTAAFYLKHA